MKHENVVILCILAPAIILSLALFVTISKGTLFEGQPSSIAVIQTNGIKHCYDFKPNTGEALNYFKNNPQAKNLDRDNDNKPCE